MAEFFPTTAIGGSRYPIAIGGRWLLGGEHVYVLATCADEDARPNKVEVSKAEAQCI